jgi:HSP90 family molecular chaperone
LFAGNTLYKDRRVFLRELIQNVVDACSLRRMYEPGVTPAIGVEFSHDLGQIIVRDNGIGMSRQWIEKYFLNIGLSFYQSDEIARVIRDANIQLSFISQFGIGFLSSFLVAQQVIIKTRQAGSDGFLITVAILTIILMSGSLRRKSRSAQK